MSRLAHVGVDLGERGRLEFLVCGSEQNRRFVEFLAMSAHYHHDERLGVGHTYPIGEPWQPGSKLDHILVSLPYPFGPELQVCTLDDGTHVHTLWLLPITKQERDFKVAQGLEAIEERFDQEKLRYWDPRRSSVV